MDKHAAAISSWRVRISWHGRGGMARARARVRMRTSTSVPPTTCQRLYPHPPETRAPNARQAGHGAGQPAHLWGGGPGLDRPGPHLVWATRKERLQRQRVVPPPDHLWQHRRPGRAQAPNSNHGNHGSSSHGHINNQSRGSVGARASTTVLQPDRYIKSRNPNHGCCHQQHGRHAGTLAPPTPDCRRR